MDLVYTLANGDTKRGHDEIIAPHTYTRTRKNYWTETVELHAAYTIPAIVAELDGDGNVIGPLDEDGNIIPAQEQVDVPAVMGEVQMSEDVTEDVTEDRRIRLDMLSAQELADLGITVAERVVADPSSAVLTADDITVAKRAVVEFADSLATIVTGPVPEYERASWATKEAAARAHVAGTATAEQTAMLQAEADARGTGETPSDLAVRIIANASAYVPIAGMIAGQRRKTQAAVDALVVGTNTRGDLDAVLVTARSEAEAMLAQVMGA